MSNETTLTVCGNLVADPDLRYTPTGQPVASFRVAATPRYYDQATKTGKTATPCSWPARRGGSSPKTPPNH
jgi:single-stranded DNA-binding protein